MAAVGAVGLALGPGAAEAASGTIGLGSGCHVPGWVGAATRTADYMTVRIVATSLCSRGGPHHSGSGTALVRAWITNQANGTIYDPTSTIDGIAAAIYSGGTKSLRGYVKLRSSNLYDYTIKSASLHWQT